MSEAEKTNKKLEKVHSAKGKREKKVLESKLLAIEVKGVRDYLASIPPKFHALTDRELMILTLANQFTITDQNRATQKNQRDVLQLKLDQIQKRLGMLEDREPVNKTESPIIGLEHIEKKLTVN